MVHCCSSSSLRLPFKLRGSYAKVWPFFTSDLIAVIKKSTSSDSQWVCVGWLERFDWMWNKQGLPQCTAKAIKWSLWGRPSSLWWLCEMHESAFCIWSSVSFLSASTSLIYLPVFQSVSFIMHLSVYPFLLICLFWHQLDCLFIYISLSFYLCLPSNAFFYSLYIAITLSSFLSVCQVSCLLLFFSHSLELICSITTATTNYISMSNCFG